MLLELALLLAVSVDGGPEVDGGLPPRGLSCLSSWYAGTPTHRGDAGWGLDMGDGGWLPWRAASPAPRDAGDDPDGGVSFDLADLYRAPYPAGPIHPVDTSDAGPLEDPGRIRVEALLMATYGATREEVAGRLVKVRFFGVRYPFHPLAAPALGRVSERLVAEAKANPKLVPYLTDIGGTWIWRRVYRSKNLSTHAWGIAIDINVNRSHYWRWTRRGEPLVWRNNIPQAVVDAFEAEGFIWGGRWQHYDTMHFEYRPELLSDTCREPDPRGAEPQPSALGPISPPR